MIDLSIIVINFNTKKLTLECLDSVEKFTKDINYELIVIDNASSDGSEKELKKRNVRLIINNENVGFAQANNQGAKLAKGENILLLNSDTRLTANIIKPLVDELKNNSKIGVISCALKNPDGSLQATGGYFPSILKVLAWMFFVDDLPILSSLISSYHPNKSFYINKHELDWVTGAFFLTRRRLWNDLKGFDTSYFMYVEELDYCYRVKKRGLKVIYNPDTSIIHYGGASSQKSFPLISEFKGLKIFYKKYFPKWQGSALSYILKTGALLRMLLLGPFKGPKYIKIYQDAYSIA